jgi:type VI secretion system secreted protein VgrG
MAEVLEFSVYLQVPKLEQRLLVSTLTGREALGELSEFELGFVVSADCPVQAEQLLHAGAVRLVFESGGEETRALHGRVVALSETVTGWEAHRFEEPTRAYRVTFAPRHWVLKLAAKTESYLQMSLPEIVRSVLQRHGFVPGSDFELRLHDQYPALEFVLQYEENDWDFVCRLVEHAGVTVVVEHGDQDRLVFSACAAPS